MKQSKAQLWYKPLLLVLCALFVVTVGLSTATTTYAARGGDDVWVNVGEIYDDGSDSFNTENLNKLYQYLTGNNTFNEVKTAAAENKTSEDFRKLNENKNITVEFGGIKWDVVYLTTAINGDVILDLWRSSDTLVAETDEAVYNSWQEQVRLNENNECPKYPSNMYSTSTIRVQTLNAGGKYSTDGDTVAAYAQREDNQYARFTMDSVEHSLTKFIAKPVEVGYQEHEYKKIGDINSYSLNDAYGTPSEGGRWNTQDGTAAQYDYGTAGREALREDGAKYDAWKNDYVWLPSFTETGQSDRQGMWKADDSLLSANSDVGNYGNKQKGMNWLRSAHTSYDCWQVWVLQKTASATGQRVNTSAYSTQNNGGVRPAIHLNLSAITRTFVTDKEAWTGDSKPYDPAGVVWTLQNTDNVDIEVNTSGVSNIDNPWWDADAHTITAKNAGKYILNITPKAGFTWEDGESTNTITVIYEVTPVEVAVEWTVNDSYKYIGAELDLPEAKVQGKGADGEFQLDVTITESPESAGEFKNAGHYEFTASFKAETSKASNYTLISATKEIDVAKADVDVKWTTALNGYKYTGYAQEMPTATAQGVGEEVLTLQVALTKFVTPYPDYKVVPADEFKNAGQYTFTASLTEAQQKNYKFGKGAAQTKVLSITQVSIAIEWEDEGKTFPYTGEVYQYPKAYAHGLGEDKFTVTVKMKDEREFKNAGSYTFMVANVEGDARANYGWTNHTVTYYIGKKSVTAPSSFDSKTYNGEEQTVVVESSEYQLKEGSGKGTTVGKYDVVLQLKDADNYKWSDSDLSEKTLSQAFEITQAAIAVTWSGADFSYKYTYGSMTTPTATAKGFGSDVLTVKVSESSGKEFKNVGEYTFTAVLEGTAKDNYTVSNPTQAYTIERASLNAALSASVVYGESISDKDVTVTISDGLQNGDDKATIEEQAKAKVEAFSFSYTAGKTHVGDEATVSAEQVQLDNYTVTFTQGKITVNQRKIKLTLEGARSNTYGDEAHGVITASAKLSEGEGNWYGSDADIEELNKQLDYKFKKDGAGAASAYVPTMGAGNYTISVEWKEGGSLAKDYELVGEPQDASYTVNKAILTVTANEHAVTYGEAPSGDSGVTFSGFKNDENVDVVSGKAVYSYDYVQYQDIDGSYHITPAKGTLNADNYDFAFVAGALKVNAKQLTVKIVLPSKLSYNDIGDFTAQLTGVVNSDDVAVKLVYNGTPNDKSSFSNSAAKPTLAGEYTVKATGLEGTKAKNYTLSVDGEQSFTVKRAAVTKPTQNVSTFTYNGQDQTYTVVGGDAKLFTVRDNVKKDANESGYTVTVSLNDKNNYMWAESDESTDELTFIFKIMKKELAVQWTGENHVYDGNVFGDPSAKAETEITGEAPFELDVRMTSPLGGTFQSKGEYTFTASFKGTDSDRSKNYSLKEDTLTQTYTISQGTNSWMTPLALEGWIYDGTSHEPSAQAKFGEAVFTYAVSEQGNYSDVKPKDAGTYWVKATVKGTADYAELTATLQFTITQKQIDAVWMTGSYVYSGASLELPTATATGIGDDGEFTLTVSPSFTGDFKNVGDYTFAAEFDTSDAKTNNYTLTTDTVTHTYTVAKQRVSVPEIADKVYSGAVQKADVLTSALYTVTENNGGTNVGNYDVKLTLADSANYAWQGSEGAEITLTFKIIKATYDMSGVTFEDVTLIEDGTSKSIAVSGQLPEGVSVTYENNNQSKCGVYEVVASFSGDYVNYNQIPDMTATLTLLRTALSVETSEVPGADDEQSGPIVSVESEKGIDPSVELVVECKDAPSEESANVLESGNSLELLERVGAVYDISLYSDGVEVQPNGEIKIKIRIPLNLQGEQFRLLHIHGDQATEVDYQIEDGYVVFTTESLSEFVFAYKVSLWWLWPLLALVVVAAVVTTIVVVHKQRKKH